MPWAIAGAVIGVAGTAYQAKKGEEAAGVGADGMDRAGQRTQQQFETTRNDLSRYRRTGAAANDRIYKLLALGGGTPDFSQFTESPGYKFRLDQGNKAIQNAGSAGGVGYLSGAQLKAATRFNQGTASQEFDSFFNRLQGVADRGQNAAVQTGNFGANAASEAGRYDAGAAGIRAGGIVDSANSVTSGIGQLSQILGGLSQGNSNRQSGYAANDPTSTYKGNIGDTEMDLNYYGN